LRHAEQEAEQIDLVAPRQPGGVGGGFTINPAASSGPPSPFG